MATINSADVCRKDGCDCDSCRDMLIALDQQLMQERREQLTQLRSVQLDEVRRQLRLERQREASKRYYESHKEKVLERANNRYRQAEEWREAVKKKNLQRYHGKCVIGVGGAEVVVK